MYSGKTIDASTLLDASGSFVSPQAYFNACAVLNSGLSDLVYHGSPGNSAAKAINGADGAWKIQGADNGYGSAHTLDATANPPDAATLAAIADAKAWKVAQHVASANSQHSPQDIADRVAKHKQEMAEMAAKKAARQAARQAGH